MRTLNTVFHGGWRRQHSHQQWTSNKFLTYHHQHRLFLHLFLICAILTFLIYLTDDLNFPNAEPFHEDLDNLLDFCKCYVHFTILWIDFQIDFFKSFSGLDVSWLLHLYTFKSSSWMLSAWVLWSKLRAFEKFCLLTKVFNCFWPQAKTILHYDNVISGK